MFLFVFVLVSDPMNGPRRLEVVDIQSKQVAVRWEPFGYNVTRCYSYNLTVQYRYRPVREEEVYDTRSTMPTHTVRNLPPFTNVSLRLILSNPEGRKESEELLVLTDEDVPGAVPVDSILGSSYEQQISLSWREPLQTYGLIRQYEISYKALSSFDTEFDLSNQSGKVLKPANETSHMFTGLYPGSTYSFTIRASTVKGFGPPVITQFTTKISAPLMPAYDQESPLNQTDSTVTVLLKPAQSRGAPVSKYQVVVEEERPRRQARGTAEILRCYPVPIHFQNATLLDSQYYFSAELPMSELRAPMPFCVGDNRTYSGYWNAPLLPHKSYGIYYQAVSTANGVSSPVYRSLEEGRDSGSGQSPPGVSTLHASVKPEQEKQSDHTVKIAGSIAGILLFIIIFLGVILLMKKRKLAKKRKETLSSRQEMTLMVNNSQHTTMVDTHVHTETSSLVQSHYKQRDSEREALPYQTGQLHPAIRVADLLQHITQMKCAEGYGFKEEYESFFEGQSAPWDSAKKDENRMKNRYGNIIACTYPCTSPASRVGTLASPAFVCVSGPMQETVYDFWRMVWQENTAAIVMVTNLVEVGRVKCCKYWPDDTEIYGDMKVTLIETQLLSEYVIRTFAVEKVTHAHIRTHTHTHAHTHTHIKSFVISKPLSEPWFIVVVCAKGLCWHTHTSSQRLVYDVTVSVSSSRFSDAASKTVQSEQYVFIHDAILEACLCGDTAIPASQLRSVYYEMNRLDPQTNSSQIKEEFRTLNMVTPTLRVEDCSIALLPRNHEKNRCMDVLPPDRCLPFLITIDGESSNYINAALMDVPSLVLTRVTLTVRILEALPRLDEAESAVLESAISFEEMSSAVQQLNGGRSSGADGLPVEFYQEFWLLLGEDIHEVFTYCMTTGILPTSCTRAVLTLLPKKVDLELKSQRSPFSCLLLRNGGGRSGVFCSISIVCEMLRQQRCVDVFHAVKTLRNNKPNMVDLLEQYKFCYEVALEYLNSA
uniref:Protein tyrosine phosphatase receptor type M n=1 Tax=Neolamprologus brichardi TaxID=32507 RepID=A0A3Q4HL01_NEOBR